MIFRRIRVERTVLKGFAYRLPCPKEVVSFWGEEGLGHALEDVVHCLVGRMKHIRFIKAVVSQFVIHDFIGRKIDCGIFEVV